MLAFPPLLKRRTMTIRQRLRQSRLTWLLAHWAPRVHLYYGILLPVAVVLLPEALAHALLSLVSIGALVFMAGFLIHDNYYCARCTRIPPWEAPKHATRFDDELRLYHRPTCVIGIGVSGLAWITLENFTTLITLAMVIRGVSYVFISALMMSNLIHGMFAPWCRYCHGDDGDEQGSHPYPPPPGADRMFT